MALFKEDGSLDIERINRLPFKEHVKEMASLSIAQIHEYFSKQPLNESKGHTRAVMVDFTLEEALAGGFMYDAIEVVNNIVKKDV